MKRFLMWIFTIPCPHCASAWTGGHPAPETICWCLCCSNPPTGEMRGWTWRWAWLARKTVAKNYDKRYEKGPLAIQKREAKKTRFPY